MSICPSIKFLSDKRCDHTAWMSMKRRLMLKLFWIGLQYYFKLWCWKRCLLRTYGQCWCFTYGLKGLRKALENSYYCNLGKSICFFLIRFRSHNQSRTNFSPWEIFEKLSRQHRDLASLSSCKFKFASLHFCTLASSNPLKFLLHEKLGKCTWVRDCFTFSFLLSKTNSGITNLDFAASKKD